MDKYLERNAGSLCMMCHKDIKHSDSQCCHDCLYDKKVICNRCKGYWGGEHSGTNCIGPHINNGWTPVRATND